MTGTVFASCGVGIAVGVATAFTFGIGVGVTVAFTVGVATAFTFGIGVGVTVAFTVGVGVAFEADAADDADVVAGYVFCSSATICSNPNCLYEASPFELMLLSLIHISEPTRRTPISYAVFCLK